jgi:hypothetical protein
MQTDFKDLESQKKKAEVDHKENILKAKNDQKAIQALEKEH